MNPVNDWNAHVSLCLAVSNLRSRTVREVCLECRIKWFSVLLHSITRPAPPAYAGNADASSFRFSFTVHAASQGSHLFSLFTLQRWVLFLTRREDCVNVCSAKAILSSIADHDDRAKALIVEKERYTVKREYDTMACN